MVTKVLIYGLWRKTGISIPKFGHTFHFFKNQVKRTYFWNMQKIKPLYHFLFWVFIFFFVLDYFVVGYETEDAVFFSLMEVVIYAGTFYANLHLFIPRILNQKGKALYFFSLAGFLILVYIPYYFIELNYFLIEESLVRNFISFLVNFVLFVLISFLYWYVILFQQERQNNLALENEKLQAELLLLKSQVSPHFLFNSLNNIYSLSVVKHDNAPLMIEKLSDLLRYIIYEGKQEVVPLEREVELLKNYVDLQLLKKLKAEKNISVTFEGVEGIHKIAPLLLINIVENCFKHSDIAYRENAFLNIQLKVDNNRLQFQTENTFLPNSKKGGVGLENVQQQLNFYYPDKHDFQTESTNSIFKINLQVKLDP